MNSLVKFLKPILAKINNNNQLYLFWVTLIYYLLSVFNLNNKTIFFSLLILWFIFNRQFHNIRLSLVFTAIVSSIFLVGKTWIVQLIPAYFLQNTDYTNGYWVTVVVTPFQILTTFLFIFILRDLLVNHYQLRNKIKQLFPQTFFIFFVLFLGWQILSAILSRNIYNLALIYSLQSLFYLILFISLWSYKNDNFNNQIMSLLGAMTIFEAFLGLLQWFKRSTFGWAIESVDQALTYFKGADQGFFSIRSLGTFNHPNELGIFSLFMFPLFFSLLYIVGQKEKKYYLLFFLSAGLILLLSLSRSAWMSVFISLLIFLYFVEKRWKRNLIRFTTYDLRLKNILYVIFLISFLGLLIIPRINKTMFFFKQQSGGEARIKLIRESLNLIKIYPIFGVGKGLSVLEMFQLNPSGITSTFPAPVHNFYLFVASESGLPALTFFFIFIFLIFNKIWKKLNNDKYKIDDKIRLLGITMSILAMLINAIIHQIFLMDFFLILVFLLLTTNEKANI